MPSTILIIEAGALRTCDMYHWPDVARIRSGFVLGEAWVNAPRPKPLSTRRMRGRAGGLTNPERAETIRELHSPKWACGAAGSALPWHGRGHRFDPGQVHQLFQQFMQGQSSQVGRLCRGLCHIPPFSAIREGFHCRSLRFHADVRVLSSIRPAVGEPCVR